MNRLAPIVLAIAGLGFLAIGLWVLIDPTVLAMIELPTDNTAAQVELRSFYGGLEIALGVFLLMCASRADWYLPGLWLLLFTHAGMGLVRLYGCATTGVFTPYFALALVWEFAFAVIAAVALFRRRGFSPDALDSLP